MNITVIAPSQLTPHQIERWRQYQRSQPLLSSPFFCPEYIQAISEVRQDVQIGIIELENDVVGFFPFQRTGWSIGRPVGLRLCDLSGLIVRSDVQWQLEFVVRRCGLAGWHFQNLVPSSAARRPYERAYAEFPYMNLEGGFQQYESERRRSGSALFEELMRKSRKLRREIGPLRFELHTNDEGVFDALLAWKSEQRERTKTANILKMKWALALLKRIRTTHTEEFAGVLSALYAGDRLAAVHMGMRSRNVLHYWIPAFNRELGKYSPGSILLLEMARAASGLGIKRLDLGAGEERYKLRFKSGSLVLAHGSVDCTLGSRLLSGAWFTGRQWSRSSSLRSMIISTKRMAQRAYYRALSFR